MRIDGTNWGWSPAATTDRYRSARRSYAHRWHQLGLIGLDL